MVGPLGPGLRSRSFNHQQPGRQQIQPDKKEFSLCQTFSLATPAKMKG